MKSQWKRRHLKCETNRSVMDILWQPLVNTLKETHILLMDVEHPTPEVVSPTWFTNFRKKNMGGWPSSVHQLLFKFRKMLGMDFSQSPWISSHQGEGSHCPPNHPCSWAIPSQWPNFDPDLAYLCTSLPKKTWYELFAPPEKNPKLLQWKGNSSTKGHVWFLLLRIGVCHNHMKQP